MKRIVNRINDDINIVEIWYQTIKWLAIVSGILTFIIFSLLILNYFQLKLSSPLNSRELLELKTKLIKQPWDISIKENIRELDLQLRKEYFKRREFSRFGSYFIIVSSAIFLISAKSYYDHYKKIPIPNSADDQRSEFVIKAKARWSIVIACLILGSSAIALIVSSNTEDFLKSIEQIVISKEFEAKIKSEEKLKEAEIVSQESSLITAQSETLISETEVSVSISYPSEEEIKKNWNRFRGPGGLGTSAYINIPVSWNGKTGDGILWKAKISLPGNNSPVVWGNRVFLTGATESKREIYCFDADTGKLLWQRAMENIPGSSPVPPKVTDDTGYAAPTAVTDGQRVCAIFANGDIACFDFSGNRIWAKSLGNPNNVYGHASSLDIYKNLLIVLYDQGGSEDNLSKLIAMDIASGENLWQATRPVPNSWATPIIINTGSREEIITSGNPWVISYDPSTGKELWRAKCLSGDVAPSPVYGDGLVFATNAYAKLAAIRPGGQGDVTQTNIVWTARDGLPDICSPLFGGGMVFLLQTYGLLTCYDAKDGKQIWDNDFAETFFASPSLVGDKIYLINEDGVTIIIQLDKEFKEIARCELGEKVSASPAFMDGRIYIRGKENLYCIANL